MSAPKWSFPPFVPGYVAQDPIQRAFFTPDVIGGLEQALVRETIQNALDASIEQEGKPVLVRFALVAVLPDAYRAYLLQLKPHLEAIHDELFEVPDFSKPMNFLVIEDFYTTGLEGDPDRKYIEEPEDKQNFYYFWRNVGRTGKKESNLGRWGLGKTVFPAVSSISTFFGLTSRYSDQRTLLMGQSVLKHHSVGDTHYTPYGYFAQFEKTFAIPLEEDAVINHFRATFNLFRKLPQHSGLSIVVASPFKELSINFIVQEAIQQYYYSILRGVLRLRIDTGSSNDVIGAQNFRSHVSNIQSGEKQFDKAAFLRLLDLVEWSMNLPDAQFIQLNPPDPKKAPDWKVYLSEEQILLARQQFDSTSRVAFRVGVKVERERSKTTEIGWFNIFLERDEDLKKAESHYLRKGIRLLNIEGHKLRGIRGLVVIDDKVLGRMLGDAENPAHTEWQKDSPSFKKYKHGPSTLSFVKNSLAVLAGKLTETGKSVERDLLNDLFYLEEIVEPPKPMRSSALDPNEPDQGETTGGAPKIASRQQPVASRKVEDGVEVFSAPNSETALSSVSVRFAYEVRKGNPFQRYLPLDFDLADETMEIVAEGAIIDSRKENLLHCTIMEQPFHIRVTGFDGIRDIVVKITWEVAENAPAL